MDGFDSDSTRWRDEANRCDAYDVTGAYPALASFDFLHFTNPRSWETKELNYIQEKFHVAYNRGNVITFCWHYYNPVTGGNFMIQHKWFVISCREVLIMLPSKPI